MGVGERCIPTPCHAPEVLLERERKQAATLRRMSDDILWDVFLEASKHEPHVYRNAAYIDVVRAELARRHAPEDLDPACTCGHPFTAHDEFAVCPDDDDDEVIDAVPTRTNVVPMRKASDSIGTLGTWDGCA